MEALVSDTERKRKERIRGVLPPPSNVANTLVRRSAAKHQHKPGDLGSSEKDTC